MLKFSVYNPVGPPCTSRQLVVCTCSQLPILSCVAVVTRERALALRRRSAPTYFSSVQCGRWQQRKRTGGQRLSKGIVIHPAPAVR